jgi:hypothetical protein
MNEEYITRPEIIAAKLDAIRAGDDPALCQQALDNPRFPELLLKLQWHSTRASRLAKLAEKLVDRFSHRLGTKTMLALGEWAPWTIEQKLAVAREIPRRQLPGHAANEYWLLSTFWAEFSAHTSHDDLLAARLRGPWWPCSRLTGIRELPILAALRQSCAHLTNGG